MKLFGFGDRAKFKQFLSSYSIFIKTQTCKRASIRRGDVLPGISQAVFLSRPCKNHRIRLSQGRFFALPTI